MTIATPALLFPAISLLLPAYTNRFLVTLSVSLLYSLYEIIISTNAINVELEYFEARHRAAPEKEV